MKENEDSKANATYLVIINISSAVNYRENAASRNENRIIWNLQIKYS